MEGASHRIFRFARGVLFSPHAPTDRARPAPSPHCLSHRSPRFRRNRASRRNDGRRYCAGRSRERAADGLPGDVQQPGTDPLPLCVRQDIELVYPVLAEGDDAKQNAVPFGAENLTCGKEMAAPVIAVLVRRMQASEPGQPRIKGRAMNLSRSRHIFTAKFAKYDHRSESPKLVSLRERPRRRTSGDPMPVVSQPDIPRAEPDISAVVLEFGNPTSRRIRLERSEIWFCS